jgi:hypothetical protein
LPSSDFSQCWGPWFHRSSYSNKWTNDLPSPALTTAATHTLRGGVHCMARSNDATKLSCRSSLHFPSSRVCDELSIANVITDSASGSVPARPKLTHRSSPYAAKNLSTHKVYRVLHSKEGGCMWAGDRASNRVNSHTYSRPRPTRRSTPG